MSWSGFKKNVGRATTQVMMKTGHVEKTSDREYEVEERRYRTLESASLRLQKEAKGYLDSLRAMTASQMRIAETIDAFYGDSGAKDGVSRSYKQAVEDLDAETVKALDGPYRSVDRDLYDYAYDDRIGAIDVDVLQEIEWDLNNKRTWTKPQEEKRDSHGVVSVDSYERAGELMDIIYRTTVLEPINRFCAYFPDINECIKKRNHKMLDYDAMRSKVKRLVEKPDKDPAKLPRTEKEAEMVSLNESLDDTGVDGHTPLLDPDMGLDLSVPSPPKARRPDIEALKQQALDEEDEIMRGLTRGSGSGLSRRSSLMSRVSGNLRKHSRHSVGVWESTALLRRHSLLSSHTPLRPSSMRLQRKRESYMSTPHPGPSTPTGQRKRTSGVSTFPSTARSSKQLTPTPFFQPSELEELMKPLREEYIQRQTNKLAQAKAAYDQLNDQLTHELPQLIDLRVPYLDPSFEALVKIQLRFCAEAYSRMAQVQQYLDASIRDQYASGDLDARVEDVLGQIRELSIAGTV